MMKVCSLLPSATEILFALGCGNQVVGVTDRCDYPPEAATKPVVSRTLVDIYTPTSAEVDEMMQEYARSGKSTCALDLKALSRAQPDVILTQDLCNVCAVDSSQVYNALAELEPPPKILVLSPKNLSEIFADIIAVGDATDSASTAQRLVEELRVRVKAVASKTARATRRPRCLFLVWTDPPIAVGCWIAEMVNLAGGSQGFVTSHEAYMRLELSHVLDYDPEFIFVSPGGFDIQKTAEEVRWLVKQEGFWDLPAVQRGQVYVMDSGYYARAGPRVVTGIEILARILHPDLVSDLIPRGAVVRLDPSALADRAPERLAEYFGRYP